MKKLYCISLFVFVSLQMCISVKANADSDLIEKLDLDKDGQITIKEAVANPAVLASFGKIDTDGNGKISFIELANTKLLATQEKKSRGSLPKNTTKIL